ncbi:MAG: DUF3025 domain-containing protein [Ectothiorhodospiraceae bacterium]|nr:DUF3025 domain-containing protein [Ectothiorhodospiraceae bacterium]
MARTTIDTWNSKFLEQSPIFDSIRDVSSPFVAENTWPSLEEFSTEFTKRNIQSQNGAFIQSVGQGAAPEKFDDHYESRIYLKGELQTRLENWHDYFNAMCWLQFPKIKASLNVIHFECSKTRKAGTNRSLLENAVTLFDECGAVIVADDDVLLDLIRGHEWDNLFCDNREAFGKNIQCYVFGHAMHEKSLAPYLGMTTHTVLLKKTTDFFTLAYSEQLKEIDQIVAGMWDDRRIQRTKDLQPFPLLGVPGWWHEKQDESFYSNVGYFRKKSVARK